MIIYVHVRITFYKTIKKTPAVPGVPDPFTNLSFISLFSHFRWSLLSSVTSDQPETQTHINLIQKILHMFHHFQHFVIFCMNLFQLDQYLK